MTQFSRKEIVEAANRFAKLRLRYRKTKFDFYFHLHNLYFRNACFNSLYYFCHTNKLHLLIIRQDLFIF